MKYATAMLAAASAVTLLAPTDAEANRYGYDRYGNRIVVAERYYSYYGRPASVQANGLCQRDTGTPTSDLNFRNKCDVEEFWNRTFNNGRRR